MKKPSRTKEKLPGKIPSLKKKIKKPGKSESQRKPTEMDMYKSELKYRQFAEDMPALICSFLPDSTLTYVNSAYCKFFSKQPEDLVGKKFLDLLPDKATRENVQRQYMSLTPENPVKTYEHEVIVADGTNQQRWRRWTDRAFFSDKGEIIHFQSIGQDITERKQMEDNLREGEERFQLITETIDEVFWMADVEIGRMFYISPGFERVWKRSRNSLYENPRSFLDAVHVEDRERVRAALTIEKTGQPFDHEYRIVLPNGNIRHIWDRGFPIRNENGQVTRYAGVATDITEHKKAEEELKKSRERYSAIFDQSPIAIEFYDSDGCLINVNRACIDLFGVVNKNEISGFKLFEDPNISKDIKTKLLNRENVRFEAEFNFEEVKRLNLYQTTCSGIKILDWSISPLTNGNVVIGYIEQIQDITERKQSEEALRESEARYRLLVDNATDVIWTLDMEMRLTYISPSITTLLGFTVEEAMKRPIELALTPASFEKAMLIFTERMALQSKSHNDPTQSSIIELEMVHKDGHTVPIEGHFRFLRDAAGKINSLIAMLRDITDRKLVEKSLRESEESYRNLFENATEIIFVAQDGKVVFQNPKASTISGYYDTEIIQRPFIEFIHPDDRDMVVDRHLKRMKGEDVPPTYSFRFVQKDGGIRWVDLSAVMIEWKGKPATLNFLTDITDRKHYEDELLHSQEQYRSLVENINDIIFSCDLQGTFTYISPAIERISRYTTSDVEGLSFSNFVYPEDLSGLVEVFKKTVSGITGACEFRALDKTGEVRWVFTRIRRVAESDKLPYITGTITDITDRKKAEEKLQNTLESLRKAIGATIQVMVSAIESRDPYTAGHQKRSSALARDIATEMGLPQEKIDGIRMAGSIHDIGKMSIPSEILSKPTNLSEFEFPLIKEHAQKGYDILKDVESPWPLAEIVYQHHERMDGSGYPRNLKGEEILMEARILAVADVVESMASHRPYRPAKGIKVALEEIENNKGTLYDEAVVDACLRLFREKGYQLEVT